MKKVKFASGVIPIILLAAALLTGCGNRPIQPASGVPGGAAAPSSGKTEAPVPAAVEAPAKSPDASVGAYVGEPGRDPAGSGSSDPSSDVAVSAPGKEDVIIAIPREPATLDPHCAGDDTMRAVTGNIYEPLYRLDRDSLEPVPCLAAGCRILDDLHWEFTIREGVLFHDGSGLTADDAVYSVNRILDPGFNVQPFDDLESIVRAEKTGDYTMVITTKYPDPVLLKRLTRLDIVSKAFTEGETGGLLTAAANGTGPYMLDHWIRGEEIALARFAGYRTMPSAAEGAPAIKEAAYRFIAGASDRSAALAAGDIDLALDLRPEDVPDLPKVFLAPGKGTCWIRFNQRAGLMVDQRLRLAANLAVDREKLIRDLYDGFAAPCAGQMGGEGCFGYTDRVSAYTCDLARAKALLEEAGYEGEPVELLAGRGRWPKEGELAEAVAGQLMEAGFTVELRFANQEEWLDALFDPKKTPDMQLSCTVNELFDMDGVYTTLLHKDGAQSAADKGGYDGMIEEARSEMDGARREEIYANLAQLLHDDPFAVYLLTADLIRGGASDLNWIPARDGGIYLSAMSFS